MNNLDGDAGSFGLESLRMCPAVAITPVETATVILPQFVNRVVLSIFHLANSERSKKIYSLAMRKTSKYLKLNGI
jgi:hypothetical protein